MIELEPPKLLAEIISGNPQADAQLKKWLNNLYEVVKDNMSRDFYLDVAQGQKKGYSTVHKFGRNEAVGTSLVPVCYGGVYQTPTATVTLEAISDDANDTAAGTGAQEITLEYLDSNFVEQTATIEMNGTSATSGTVAGVLRLFRLYVSRSGTYATASSASQNGTITVRVSGAGATWAQIPEVGTTTFGVGQSLIGAYTVPAGKTAYILSTNISVDSGKAVDCYFFARNNADDISTPFTGILRSKNIYSGVTAGLYQVQHKTYEAYTEKTDIGYLASVASGTADVSVEFELLLVDN